MARPIRHRLPAVCAVLILTATPLGAQTEPEPEWTQTLRDQLSQEQNCELGYMTGVHEFKFFDGMAANGRAHCLDKRQFDFTWAPQELKFDIQRCGPTVC